ncbi:MAG TPA: restriction endonuclease subunit S [Ktedonobacterales bacterium]|nr:restriction endonuclease subunit S [Ktedonobacterales bacterium]
MTQTLPDASTAATNPTGSHRRYPAYRDSGIVWLGEIPAQWEVKRLKYVSRMRYGEALASETRESGDVAVFGSNGMVDTHNRHNTAGPCLIIGRKGSYGKVTYSSDRCFVIDTAYAIDCHETHSHIRWLFYALSCLNLDQTSQDTGVPGLSREVAYNHWLPLPPLDEQLAIAAYLDWETARIDALVAKKQRLIELLREKRAALISHAVTRGLDPNAPLKDSGVDPIGAIPKHWEVRRNRRTFQEVDKRSADGQEELLTVSHITGVTPRSEKPDVNMFLALTTAGYKCCEPGDLVINTMWAWMGAVGVARQAGVVSPSYNVYRVREEHRHEYSSEYLNLLYRISAYVCEMTRFSQGVWESRLRLYPDAFFELHTITPPIEEQQVIVQYCSEQVKRMEAFSQRLTNSIEKLKEYRAAVIAAAVTGQFDVRGEGTINSPDGGGQESVVS